MSTEPEATPPHWYGKEFHHLFVFKQHLEADFCDRVGSDLKDGGVIFCSDRFEGAFKAFAHLWSRSVDELDVPRSLSVLETEWDTNRPEPLGAKRRTNEIIALLRISATPDKPPRELLRDFSRDESLDPFYRKRGGSLVDRSFHLLLQLGGSEFEPLREAVERAQSFPGVETSDWAWADHRKAGAAST